VAIATINPATGGTLKTYDEMSEAELEQPGGRRYCGRGLPADQL